MDVQGGLCVLSPQGRSQGDVPSLLTIDRRHDKLCCLISLQFVVFGLNRMRGENVGRFGFFTAVSFSVVVILQLYDDSHLNISSCLLG